MSQPPTSENSPVAEIQAAILDALPAHIALVDAEGVIRAVNASWRRFASANLLPGPGFGVGGNYLELCERVRGDDAEVATEVARGLRRVLRGDAQEFLHEYPCHSPTEQRWFRLTVTDMMMPVMDGPALIAALRRINPSVRIIAASGLNAQATTVRSTAAGVSHFLGKPYSADAMLTLLKTVLTENRPPDPARPPP
jgi:CheY-like chemotaxis protein